MLVKPSGAERQLGDQQEADVHAMNDRGHEIRRG
jgi:hypothetical protein